MKRSKTLFGALLSAFAITAFSCTTDPLNPEETVQEAENFQTRTVTLTAAIADADTKAAIDNAGVFSWKANDAIAVYTSAGNFREFTLTKGAGEKSATFEGTLADGETVGNIAVYPYSEALKLDGNNLTVNLPAYLDYVDGETHSAPMLAKIDRENPSSLSFKHLGGFMRFNVTNVPLGAATCILDAANLQITGNFNVDVTAESPVLVATDNSKNKVFKFNIAPPAAIGTKATYLIPVPANTYKGFTLKFADKAGQTLEKQYKTNATENIVTRSGLINMPEWTLKNSLHAPELRAINKGHNAVVFEWIDKTGISFSDRSLYDSRYEFALYKKGESTPINKYTRAFNNSDTNRQKFYKEQNHWAIVYGNLEPETTYIFRIRSITKNANTQPGSAYAQIEYTTPPITAEKSNVVYALRFDNIIYGTDPMNFAAGWNPSSLKDASITTLEALKDAYKTALAKPDGFSWMGDLGNMSAISHVNTVELPGCSNINTIYGFLGYIRMNNNGTFTTPALGTQLGEATKINISFDAACYRSWNLGTPGNADNATVKVTIGEITKEFKPGEDWSSASLTFEAVGPEDKITFTAVNRFYLDNIVVTKVTE